MLENENDSYFQGQKLQRQMAEMYQLVHGVCRQKISKGAAESLLVRTNMKVMNNYSTLVKNNPSLENTACQAEKSKHREKANTRRQHTF
jgi:hypothetical protein